MSVPKSPVLTCTRGFLAQADVKLQSPASNQTQNVNVLVYPDTSKKEESTETNPYTTIHESPSVDNLAHYNRDEPIKTRSIDTANNTLTSLEGLNSDKDQMITALNMLLDIYENNPLIVNKYVIADDIVLGNLIQALTGADEVTLYKEDYEPKCFDKKLSFSVVSKIIVKKGDDIMNFKYQYPAVVEFLEQHHISRKFVV